MEPGAVIALVVGGLGLIALPVGGLVRYLLAQIGRLETKLDLAVRTAETKQETIDEQRRQLDKLEITAEITHRFLDQLPKQLPPKPSGDR